MGDQAWARANTANFQYVEPHQSIYAPVTRADSVAMGGGPAASGRLPTGENRPGSANAGFVPRRASSIRPVIRQQMRTPGPVAAPAPTVPKISSQGFRVEHKGSYQGEVKVPEILLMGKAKRIQNASVGRQMRAELTKYKLRPGALDDLGEDDEEEKDIQRDFKSTSPTQTLASSMGSRTVSPMSLRGKGMGSFAYDQQPYGGTREMRSLQRQIAETEDAAHESRLETERVLARTQDTRRKVEERVGRVKENNHQLDSELGEIERQIEELKKVSRAQMDEIRALRDTNRAKDSALRDEHKVLEGMEMSVKDAMAAAREERVRRQEEAERKAKAIAKAKEEEEEAKRKAQENKKAAENRGGADSEIDELLYDGDRAEVVAPHPELDALIAAQPVALNFSGGVKPSVSVVKMASWLAGMRAPSDWSGAKGSALLGLEAQPSTPPEGELVAEHVYGFRGQDCKDLLLETVWQKVVWGAGAVGIALDISSGRQRLFTGHSQPISTMSLHPDGITVASGEIGREARVLVWDSETLESSAGLWGVHQGGVACLAFSRDGTRLASVGLDPEHSLCVWDWRRQVPLSTAKAGPQPVISIRFSPHDRHVVTVGVKHLKFWDVSGGELQSVKCDLEGKGSLQGFLCVDFLPVPPISDSKNAKGPKLTHVTIVGTQDGSIYVFANESLKTVHKRAHEAGPVVCLTTGQTADGVHFALSGGADGTVKIWETDSTGNLKKIKILLELAARTRDTGTPFAGEEKAIRGLALGKDRLNISTSLNEVFSFQMQYERLRGSSDAIGSHKVLLQAHAGGVVAMDAHPTRNECTTVGQDSTVRVWDLDERALCAFLRVDQDSGDATAVAYSPDGVILALGMTKGRILFLVSPEAGGAWGHGLHECAHRDLNEEKRFVEVGSQNVSALRYSPDGQMLAVGMKNGRLAVVRIEEEGTGYDVYQVLEKVKGHPGPIYSIDFSEDGMKLVSGDGEGNLNYYRLGGKEGEITLEKDPGSMRDVIWASYHCTMGWAVQGVSDQGALGGGVVESLAVSRSLRRVVACEGSEIRLVRYPALTGAVGKRYSAHASPPNSLRFLVEDNRVVSSGMDGCVIQWRHDGLHNAYAHQRASVEGLLLPKAPADRPTRGVVLRLACSSIDMTWDSAHERQGIEQHLATEIASALNVAVERVSATVHADVLEVAADVELLPGPMGWALKDGPDASPSVLADRLEEMIADGSSVLRSHMKSLLGEYLRIADDLDRYIEEDAGEELGGFLPWLGASAPPSDWDPLMGSAVLSYPPTEQLVDAPESKTDKMDEENDDHDEEASERRKKARVPAPLGPPEHDLELEFVHGYNGVHSRDNARYADADGRKVAYCAGALGVVLDVEKREQILLKGHREEVTCIALHADGHTIATGEGGRVGAVRVWDISSGTAAQVCKLGWVHPRGVLTIMFMGEDLLVSVGADPAYVIAVWNWRLGVLECCQDGCVITGAQSIFAVCGIPGQESLVTVGDAHVMFWSVIGGTRLVGKSGIWGLKGRPQMLLCVAPLSRDKRAGAGTVLTGTHGGGMLVWRGRLLVQRIKSPLGGALTSVRELPGGGWVASGGSDGQLSLWELTRGAEKDTMKLAQTFDVPDLTGVGASCVRSLDCRTAGEGWVRMLVGFASCALAEIEVDLRDERGVKDLPSARRVVAGGHMCDVKGLCVHPEAPICATVGLDGELRAWDVQKRKMIWHASLGQPAQSVDWRVGGGSLAVGLVKGGVMILDARKLCTGISVNDAEIVRVGQKREDAREVKYSPDGRLLAVGGGSKIIDVYQADANYNRRGKCRGHEGAVVYLDWTASSRYLRSGDQAREALIWNLDAACRDPIPQEKNAFKLVDELWSTHQCPLTWASQGLERILPSMSRVLSTDCSKDTSLFAVGDSYGAVTLHRFPCLHPRPPSELTAHTACAHRVRFTFDDACVLSVGGSDMCLMQWKNPRVVSEQSTDVFNLLRAPPAAEHDEGGMASLMPFEAAIHAPTDWKGGSDELRQPPKEELELEHVFGYGGHGGRANAWISAGGRVVFPAASVCVAQELGFCGYQRIMRSHDSEVTCVARHPNRHVFASGQRGEPIVCVWDDSQLDAQRRGGKIITRVRGESAGWVSALAFSPGGMMLAGVGGSDASGYWLSVWDCWTGDKFASASAHSMPALAVGFDPGSGGLVTCGVQHVKFWELKGVVEGHGVEGKKPEGTLVPHKGRFAGRASCTTMLCLDFASTDVKIRVIEEGDQGKDKEVKEHVEMEWRTLIGTQSGDVLVWKAHVLMYVVHAHTGPVIDMCAMKDDDSGAYDLATGGADGIVMLWKLVSETGASGKEELQKYPEPIILSAITSLLSCASSGRAVSIRSVLLERSTIKVGDVHCYSLLVGTACNEILLVTLHHLSTAPSDMNTEPSATSIATMYRTSREDGTTSNLTAVQVIMQGPCTGTGNDGSHLQDIRAVAAHSSNEKEVATCGADGMLRVWDTETRRCVAIMRVCQDRYAQSLAYSQDAKGCVHLAVGMRGKILVLNASNQLTPGDDLPQVTVLQGKDSGPGSRTVTCLRYSTGWQEASTSWLAAGTHQGSIVLFIADVSNGIYTKVGLLKGHAGPVAHIDFGAVLLDTKSTIMRSNSSKLDICFWDLKERKELPSAGQLRDQSWSSHSCAFAWHTQGLLQEGESWTAVGGVDQSSHTELLAAGQGHGRVSLGRSPCVVGTNRKLYMYHSGGAVASVRFSCSGHYVWSVGGEDLSLMQWRVQLPSSPVITFLIELEHAPPRIKKSTAQILGHDFEGQRPFESVAKLLAPSGFDGVVSWDGRAPVPREELELEHVNGICGGLSPAAYNNDGDVVFAASGVGVVQGAKGGKQSFYTGHTAAITCLAVEPSGKLCATGQSGPGAKVCVWGAKDSRHMTEMPCLLHSDYAVACVTWCSDGERLASVGSDPLHTLCVWCWKLGKKSLLFSAPADSLCVLAIGWNPFVAGWIVTVGEQHVKFWCLSEGGAKKSEYGDGSEEEGLQGTKGILGKAGLHVTASCLGFVEESVADPDPDPGKGYTLTGMMDGSVYIWRASEALRVLPAQHVGPVLSLCSAAGVVITGGADGMVKVWKGNFGGLPEEGSGNVAPDRVLDAARLLKACGAPWNGNSVVRVQCVRTRVREAGGWEFVLVTGARELLEVDLSDLGSSAQAEPRLTNVGHAIGSVRAVAAHPQNPLSASIGDDGVLRLWDLGQKICSCSVVVDGDEGGCCLDWRGPEGTQLAVGLSGGDVVVFSVDGSAHPSGLTEICRRARGGRPGGPGGGGLSVRAVKYSADGALLAVGAGDKVIEVLDAGEGYARRGVCKGHAGGLLGVDWTETGGWMQSWCDAGELKYWCMTALRPGLTPNAAHEYKLHTKPFTLHAEIWNTMHCPLVWAARGAWGEEEGETTAVARARGGAKWLVSGGSSGQIKLFSYPACISADCTTYKGHAYPPSSFVHVPQAGVILSTGGPDLSVMQWHIR